MQEQEYDFAAIEKKWQARWEAMELFRTGFAADKPKCHVLTMYPYPSGVLHMGHVINYTIGDVVVRYKLLRGFDVLSPMGWDSFGLPAENAAIRTGVHPHEFTESNIARMTAQMKRAGWGYDWSREVATSHEDYYHWTQWFFLQFFKKGLAVKKTAPVNWCDSCGTVLANEQVKDGVCERCGSMVRQKDMSQWFFRMSEYAQRLLDGHESLRGKWPDAVLAMQEEWIGRSEGAKVVFHITETGGELPIFTTRPDTLFGVTFMSLAPEHPLIEELVRGTPHEARVMPEVEAMRKAGTSAKDLAEREKRGVWTGFHVTNPVNGESVPLWVANFALMSYGTGAVMAVPAHDQRDFEFARKYDIPVKVVIQPEGSPLDPQAMTAAYIDPGIMTTSGPFDGRLNTDAMADIIAWIAEQGYGEGTVNFRLRDWLISRQRYWGAPIPVLYCDTCGTVPVPESDLPVRLPTDVAFQVGENPLASAASFVQAICPVCGGAARRETDTMDTFVDSSWYFLRYCDPKNPEAPFSPDSVATWMPVDQYIGGIEHATMHLIYARFFTMALHDLGLVPFTEPFTRLFCQGMVCKTAYYCETCKWIPEDLVTGGERKGDALVGGTCTTCGLPARPEMTKISKSKLNIVDPDKMFDRMGADTVRLYMLSDAPPDRMQVWSEAGLNGAWRTIQRLRTLVLGNLGNIGAPGEDPGSHLNRKNAELQRKTHQCILSVTDAIEGGFHFNTAIARCNELINLLRAFKGPANPAVLRHTLETVLRILSPVIPHIAEELWEAMGHAESIFVAGWPEADASLAQDTHVEVPVQVNGKVRARIQVLAYTSAEALEAAALAEESVRKHVEGKEIVKRIVIPDKLVNLVVKG